MGALGRNMHETNNVIRLVKTKFSPCGLTECSVMLCTTFSLQHSRMSLESQRLVCNLQDTCQASSQPYVNMERGLIAWKGEQTTL